MIRHDGRSFGTLALGVVQYGLVLCGWIAGCGVLIAATAGLTSGLLQTLLDANDFFARRDAALEEAADFLVDREDTPPQPRALFEPRRAPRRK